MHVLFIPSAICLKTGVLFISHIIKSDGESIRNSWDVFFMIIHPTPRNAICNVRFPEKNDNDEEDKDNKDTEDNGDKEGKEDNNNSNKE